MLRQILVLVDLEGAVDARELETLLPDRRDDRRILSLRRDGDAPAVVRRGPRAQPIDWPRIGRAIETIAAKARDASQGCEVDLYIAGQGPLCVFVHLGHALSTFRSGTLSFITWQWPGAPWEPFPLTGPATPGRLLETRRVPGAQSPASGQVALYIDVIARSKSDSVFAAAVEQTRDKLAAVVELIPIDGLTIDPRNAASLAIQIQQVVANLGSLFPHASLGLFPGGSAILAFLLGRAIHLDSFPSATLYDYRQGGYDLVYTLPFQALPLSSLASDQKAIAARHQLQTLLRASIEALQSSLRESDLGPPFRAAERKRLLQQLTALRPTDAAQPELSLSLADGTFAIGSGLLEALRLGNGTPQLQRSFAQLLLLRELFHDHQGIRSSSYADIGRAGAVFDAIDDAAHAFALRAAIRSVLRERRTALTPDEIRCDITPWFDAVLHGLESFDRWHHGPQIRDLAERRLHRYLTWHLQRARADTIDTPDDVHQLLETSLTLELAPLHTQLDRRGDRQVISAASATELLITVDGRLIRHAARAGFDPGELVSAARTYDAGAIRAAMRSVVDQHHDVLARWRG